MTCKTFALRNCSFNTQPPEGGWADLTASIRFLNVVSTHSRPKAAGNISRYGGQRLFGFNTQPPEGGWHRNLHHLTVQVGFNTQPPEGGWFRYRPRVANLTSVSTHSRPKAAGASLKSLAPSGFAAPISLGSQEKREREYNTAFSVTPAFAIS